MLIEAFKRGVSPDAQPTPAKREPGLLAAFRRGVDPDRDHLAEIEQKCGQLRFEIAHGSNRTQGGLVRFEIAAVNAEASASADFCDFKSQNPVEEDPRATAS